MQLYAGKNNLGNNDKYYILSRLSVSLRLMDSIRTPQGGKELSRYMKKAFRAAAVFLVLSMLTGCTEIAYNTPSVSEDTSGIVSSPPLQTQKPDPSIPDKYQEKEVNINTQDYSEEFQLESVCDNTCHTYLMGYTGEGYIQIDTHEYATFRVHVPSTQYYKLTIYMCAFDTGVDVIIGGNKTTAAQGDYETFDGVSKGIIYEKDITMFTPFSIDGIYLKKGDNIITLQSVSGMAYMDKVTLENGRSVSSGFYSMSNSPINPNADINTVKTLNFFSEIYGKKTLTGQRVTSGTDAELAAIYELTGRLPAIRIGDLSCAQERSPSYDENKTDIELAKKWAKRGGIVSYGWTWYSPSDKSHYLSSMSDFNFEKVYTDTDISEASIDTIEKLYGNGEISKECFRLIQDMEEMAKVLKDLQDENVTVLFSPLPDGGKGGYWWSDSSKSYKWLWKTMVKRFNDLYGLTNIIWVWNGGGEDFYPGDEYVDIVGENVYNTTGDSGNARFMGTIYYKSSRATAMTDCLQIPDPDILAQDNARWLWFALSGGDCLINENGKLTGRYSSDTLLEKAYNHESFLTLDEISGRFV